MSSESTIWFINGASRGIGFAVVEKLLATNPSVFVYAGARDPIKASALQQAALKYPGKIAIVKYIAGDVDGNKDIAKVIQEKHSRVDVVLGTAGCGSYLGPAADTPPEVVRTHFETNVIGNLVVFQAMLPLLKASKNPKFIPLSSIGGSLTAFTISMPLGMTAYAMSKAALNVLARRIHFENEWIVCFPLSPGAVETDMAASHREMDNSGVLETLEEQSPEKCATLLVKIVDECTREKDGGEFIDIDGSKISW
ncbi:NAD(P)-binding protein [Gymnopus androsaceus JB14]|uniref:NAD(P)-binding protein n=1 Tax=Gymnopus androsaceus JB14 TaxID=1447944 RepID=A0A6A4HK50_9AGAR|nr:NAD(P)-binding protein [Gymnopus androsaceus JB14]